MIRYFQLISPKQTRAVRLLSGQLKNCAGFNLSIQYSNRYEADLVSPAHILTGHEVDGRLRWIWFQSDVNFPSSLPRPPVWIEPIEGDLMLPTTQLNSHQCNLPRKNISVAWKSFKGSNSFGCFSFSRSHSDVHNECTGEFVEVSTSVWTSELLHQPVMDSTGQVPIAWSPTSSKSFF